MGLLLNLAPVILNHVFGFTPLAKPESQMERRNPAAAPSVPPVR